MAMVDTVYWLPTGRLAAQVGWLGPKVSDHGAVAVFIVWTEWTLAVALLRWQHYKYRRDYYYYYYYYWFCTTLREPKSISSRRARLMLLTSVCLHANKDWSERRHSVWHETPKSWRPLRDRQPRLVERFSSTFFRQNISIYENNWNRNVINSTAASSIYRERESKAAIFCLVTLVFVDVFFFFRFKRNGTTMGKLISSV